MKTLLALLVVTGCVAGSDEPSAGGGGGGGKADDGTVDGGTPDAPVLTELTGSCTVTATAFHNNYGYPQTSHEPTELSLSIDEEKADGTVDGTVHVASPWGQIPDGLWRGWCHLAHQDFQPADSPCAIGPYTIKTGALGFGGGFVAFRHVDDAGGGLSLYVSASVESGRDSYFDPDYTRTTFSCSLAN
ncbi:MAG TPA: hypothetical protein VFV99_11930 [Kofleriaceae bacterium]|nr:hypothetical protein [Kofleriaceae bacterium]